MIKESVVVYFTIAEISENNLTSKMETTDTAKPKTTESTPTTFNNSTFTLRSSILGQPKLSSGFVLRPSQLGAKLDSKLEKTPAFALSPSRLNPFAKSDSSDMENGSKSKDSNGSTDDIKGAEVPKFVPLAVTEASKQSTCTNSVTSAPNFVFGQNLHERIVAEGEGPETCNSVASTSHANANGTSELLFSSAVKSSVDSNKGVKSLTESAREYEESRANKRKYEEVTVVTGEEDERNVMQINCKLFAFDKATSNWQERGRGTLRLNDKEDATENGTDNRGCWHSRLVFRTAGSLRVVLNTKIWAEMTIDLASPKSLRLTAMDSSGQIKVFLIMVIRIV